METSTPKCPECGSGKQKYEDGLRYLNDGSQIQRWLCRDCGFRFSKDGSPTEAKNGFSRPRDKH